MNKESVLTMIMVALTLLFILEFSESMIVALFGATLMGFFTTFLSQIAGRIEDAIRDKE